MKKSQLLWFYFVLGAAALFPLFEILTIPKTLADTAQINFYSPFPPTCPRMINCYYPWFASITEVTNSTVKFNTLPFQHTAPSSAGYNKILSGEADISVISVSQLPQQFPLCNILGLTGISLKDTKMASYVVWNTYKKIPEIKQEFDRFQVLFAHAVAPMVIATKTKPIRIPSDLSGLKTYVMPATKPIAEAAGGIYQKIPIAQTGVQIKTGKIDACITGWPGQKRGYVLKSAKYFTELPMLGSPAFFIVMNKIKWNALDADVQQAIMHESGDKASQLFGEADALFSIKAKELINSEPDKELIVLTPLEEAQWLELVAPFKEKMIVATEAKDLPAQKVFNEMVRLVGQYRP